MMIDSRRLSSFDFTIETHSLADQLIHQPARASDHTYDLPHSDTTTSELPLYTLCQGKASSQTNKMHQDSIKEELEDFKPQIARHALPTYTHSHRKQFKCQGLAETESYSLSSGDKGNVGFSSSITTTNSSAVCSVYESSPCSTFSTKAMDCTVNVHFVTQSSPSLVLSYVEDMPQAATISHINVADDSTHEYPPSSYRDIHISARLMEDFLELARDNTNNDLETCGILGAFLKDEIFYVTTLIIPKQESTSSSCQALNEEEIYAIQDEYSLFPLGWIHTHPSQTCFMSSIDLHTHFSYQVMLPEAVAIVMAPTDPSRSYGIFRLSNPSGITVVKDCDERGFHTHQEPSDGRPIYEECSNVYINPNMRFEIFDLR